MEIYRTETERDDRLEGILKGYLNDERRAHETLDDFIARVREDARIEGLAFETDEFTLDIDLLEGVA